MTTFSRGPMQGTAPMPVDKRGEVDVNGLKAKVQLKCRQEKCTFNLTQLGHLLGTLIHAGRVRRKVFLNEDNVSVTGSMMNAILHPNLFLQ